MRMRLRELRSSQLQGKGWSEGFQGPSQLYRTRSSHDPQELQLHQPQALPPKSQAFERSESQLFQGPTPLLSACYPPTQVSSLQHLRVCS